MTRTTTALAMALMMATASVNPAFACDPEDLKAEYRNLCATPTDAILSLVEAAAPKLPPDRAATLLAKARQAKSLCESDKYDDGMKLAVRVARALGASEQERGLPQDRLTRAQASTQIAAR